jgi:hypothetical protein
MRTILACAVLAVAAAVPAHQAETETDVPSLPRMAALDDTRLARSFAELRGARYAVLVWKESCAPCLAELSRLNDIAAHAPKWRFITLALDDAVTARRALPAQARAKAEAWIALDSPSTVLRALNPDEPALPLSVAVDGGGRICARRVGLLGSDILSRWSAQCST